MAAAYSRTGVRRWDWLFLTVIGVVFLAFTVGGAFATGGPSIASDKSTYETGGAVALSGSGWAAGETVHVTVDDASGDAWSHEVDVTAADDGTLADSLTLPDVTGDYTVSATATSGSANASFTVAAPTPPPSDPGPPPADPPTTTTTASPTPPPPPPTIASDQIDYAPGDMVTLTGGNWQAGESVHIFVNDNVGQSWSRNADVTADSGGHIIDQFQLPSFFVATYAVVATGSVSGTASTSFTDTASVSIDSPPNPNWFRTVAGGFDISISGKYTCQATGSGANRCVTPANITVDIYPSNGGGGVSGTTLGTKTITGLSTGANNASWTTTYQFRTAPVGSQLPIPSDGKFDVQAIFNYTGGSGAAVQSDTSNDYFGVDNTAPTSAVTSVTQGNPLTASGTASDATSGLNNGNPKPLHVEIRTGSAGGALVAGTGQDLNVQGNGTWSYSTSTFPTAPGTYCVVSQATDMAGNVQSTVGSSCYTITPADSTPPVITKTITGTLGSNGWFTSNVTVAWSVTDPQSTVVIDSGCGTQNFTSETTGATSSCSAHSAGGSSSDSVTVKIDKTGPSAALSVTAGSAGTHGWYTTNVTVHASGADAVSGGVTCSPDQSQTTETTGTTFNGSCTNAAGLSTNAAPLSVKLDKSGPSAALAVSSGTLGLNGWYTSNVTVSTTGSDSISGPPVCTGDQFLNTDSPGTLFSGSCTNDAGLTTNAAQLTVKRDATAPTAAATPSRVADHNGWYNHAFTVHYSGSDAGSGLAGCTSDQPYSGPDTLTAVLSGSCTDNAGNASLPGFSFKYDGTGPSAALAVTAGTLGANGWYTSNVTVSTSGMDSISSPVICTGDQFQTTETTGAVFDGKCTNDAGLETNASSLTVKLDKTGPSAALAVSSGTLGLTGWYTSDVTVSTTGSDAVSGTASCSSDQFLTTDSAGTVFNGSCTNGAGLSTNAAPLTVKRDTTAPTAAATPDRGADHNGWYNHQFTVHYSGSDTGSGLAGCTADQQYSGPETLSGVLSGSCTDNAGNATLPGFSFKYDGTGPSASLAVTAGTAGTNGWYTSDVTVSTSGSDSISSPVTCTADQFQTTETTGAVFDGKCTNDAGLETSASSLTVKLDKTGPSAALAVTAGTAGTNGWYTSNVTVHASGDDDVSGGVTCSPDQFQTAETTGHTFNGSCTNAAGLSTGADQLTVKLDKSGPSAALSVTAGTAGTNGWYTSDVTVSTSGADSISDPTICTGDQFQTDETTGSQFDGGCTNDAGLTTHAAPLTVKLDKTAPSAQLEVTVGTAGSNGWFTSNVTVHTSGSDSISSPVDCTADQFQTAETTGTDFNGSCTNDAGLTRNALKLTVKLDKTAPVITDLGPTTNANGAGWYNHDVVNRFKAEDGTSGLDALCLTAFPASGGDRVQSQTTTGEGSAVHVTSDGCTDVAGNSAAGKQSVDFKIDQTDPVISDLGATTLPNGAGWYNHDVINRFKAEDALSGLAASCVTAFPLSAGDHLQNQTTNAEGGAVHVTSDGCSDVAGNAVAGKQSADFMIDKTAPHITNVGLQSGVEGNPGWYVSAVVNRFHAADSLSGLNSACKAAFPSGDRDVSTGSSEGSAVKVASGPCSDVAGNMAASIDSAFFKIDLTAPSISDSGVHSGTLGSNNWYVSAVVNRFHATDGTSGLSAACQAAFPSGDRDVSTGTSEGSAVKVASGPCTDVAGNTAASINSAAFKIDLTAPSITDSGIQSGTPGSNGWYVSAVVNRFHATDGTSGLNAACQAAFPSGDRDVSTGTSQGSAVTVASGPCTDVAGNTAASIDSAPFKIDLTAPVITNAGVQSGVTGSNGWYVSAVVNRFHAADATSGLSTACQLAFPSGNRDVSTGTSEGSAVKVASGPCTDVAGNTAASIDSAAFKIDLTDPTVTITAPSTGVSTIALAVQAKGTSGDGPSGISTVSVNSGATDNAGSWTTSSNVNLNCGANTLTALATDKAGRTKTASITVTRLCFGLQYLQPIDQTTSTPVVNAGKYGRVIPVKVIVSGPAGTVTEAYLAGNGLTLQIGVNGVSCSGGNATDDIEAYADAGQSSGGTNLFRLASSSDNSWIYNLDTKAPPGVSMVINSCYRFDVYVSDGVNKVKISTATYALFTPTK